MDKMQNKFPYALKYNKDGNSRFTGKQKKCIMICMHLSEGIYKVMSRIKVNRQDKAVKSFYEHIESAKKIASSIDIPHNENLVKQLEILKLGIVPPLEYMAVEHLGEIETALLDVNIPLTIISKELLPMYKRVLKGYPAC